MAVPGDEVLTSEHVLEYPYSRSVGPVIGAFLTGLRDGRVLGATGSGGRVIVPPTEYDPDTAEDTGQLVEVGPEGTVTSWAWVASPGPQHPLATPFAWVLVRLDGADTAMVHALDVPGPEAVSTGLRVRPDFRPDGDRLGAVTDIRAFVPAASPAGPPAASPAGPPAASPAGPPAASPAGPASQEPT